MPLYDGTPSIKLEGDKAKALARIPDAKLLLAKTQAVATRAGIATFGMTQRTEGGYLYALTANGVNRILVSVDPEVPDTTDEETPEIIQHNFPDILSGVVFSGLRPPDTFAATSQCRRTHDTIPAGRAPNERLTVEPHKDLPELKVKGRTQYYLLKPSMYSGKMTKVVQTVMGFGRIDISKLADPRNNRQTPELSNYLKEIKSTGVQVRFDYKWHRTHGIYTADDDTLWLIEISVSNGVLAKPLPFVPLSNTQGFLDSAALRNDEDLRTVVEELGCLPNGNSFPRTSAGIERAIARGDILRLLSAEAMNPFYKNSPYSTALGWAFSENGEEAHNTAYGWEDGDPNQTGYHYQVNIKIGALVTNRLPGTPVAAGSAALVKQSSGHLWGTGRLTRFLPFKPHEPLLPGLLSHDASGGGPVLCDTTVFVCFDGDDLKTVKFYYNAEEEPYNTVDDPRYPGECIVAGSWTVTTTSGIRGYPRMMYTNDFDDRRILQETKATITIVSEDLGYNPPVFSDFVENLDFCTVVRFRMFRNRTDTITESGDFVSSVVAIPAFSRSAYYYAKGDYMGGKTHMWTEGYPMIRDPNMGYGHRNFLNGGIYPAPEECRSDVATCGRTHTDRRVFCLSYEPVIPDVSFGDGPGDSCWTFADNGVWLELCEPIEPLCVGTAPDRRPSAGNTSEEGSGTAKLFLVSPGYGGPLTLPLSWTEFGVWMLPSPNPDTGDVQSIQSSYSALGAESIVYDTNLRGRGTQLAIGVVPSTIGASDNPTFIGVNGG